jgi:hypothetical protein
VVLSREGQGTAVGEVSSIPPSAICQPPTPADLSLRHSDTLNSKVIPTLAPAPTPAPAPVPRALARRGDLIMLEMLFSAQLALLSVEDIEYECPARVDDDSPASKDETASHRAERGDRTAIHRISCHPYICEYAWRLGRSQGKDSSVRLNARYTSQPHRIVDSCW